MHVSISVPMCMTYLAVYSTPACYTGAFVRRGGTLLHCALKCLYERGTAARGSQKVLAVLEVWHENSSAVRVARRRRSSAAVLCWLVATLRSD